MPLAEHSCIWYNNGQSVYAPSGPELAINIMYTREGIVTDVYLGGAARLVGTL